MNQVLSTLIRLFFLLALPTVVRAQFNYTTNNGTITVTGYTGPGGTVTIPDTITGLPVTSIGGFAFSNSFSLTSVTIPASVSSIGSFAFLGCSNLTTVVIPNGVTNLANCVFLSCSSLGSVAIPAGINFIDIGTFAGCISLTNVTIPNSIADIRSDAFDYCISLTSVAIPDSVTNIDSDAFYSCTGLTNLTIPNSVNGIGSAAFESCSGLTNVNIGSGVISIGFAAFGGCTNLTAINVDALNSAYGSVGGVLFDKSQTTLLTCPPGKAGAYAVTNGVSSIGFGGFIGCVNLTSVAIPSSVTNIGTFAFAYCSSMTDITADPANLVYSSLNGVLFDKSQTTIVQYPCGRAGPYAIPDGVTVLGANSFATCSGLTGVTIPNSVTDIRDRSFSSCTSLTNVTIPGGVTNVGGYAFHYCTNLISAYFTGDSPSVGTSAFFGNANATVYYLPNTLGWSNTFAGLPAVLWNPIMQAVGVGPRGFAFTITGTTNIPIAVVACTDLANPTWTLLQTCTLTNGSIYFGDPAWTNYPSRFYRIRSP